ncbi:MAG: sigma 54-interacting transcriptional regulator [Candidatus Cloacimonetes bacterium]|nr:sigma 54-interacting transcriptional regulator [Candidatus Cloacimonadota bacterium]
MAADIAEKIVKSKPCQPTGIILDSISDGVFTVDGNWRITFFNRAAENITGIRREEAIDKLCSEVFRSSMCETDCALRKTLQNGQPLIDKACYFINNAGVKIPISISTAVMRDSKGNICGGAETFRDLREVTVLRKELSQRYHLGDMVSRSIAMKDIFEIIPIIAESTSTVLIEGETGTGKELLAKAIHGMSNRADMPFIALNCAALPDTLLESELFGYKKGAFTGANQDKPGRFKLAEKGTLLLDEIGEISPALQIRLLRVLQEQVYEPLGGISSIKSDVRIIAATNKNLEQLVKDGVFREDLFYRINVIKLELPPLRTRKEDIPILVEHFINRFNLLQRKQIKSLSNSAMALLMAHNWHGNVRELENVIEHAFVLCQSHEIKIEHLPGKLSGGTLKPVEKQDFREALMKTEREILLLALERNEFNRQKTAAELGIHQATLYRKLKTCGISSTGMKQA